MISTVPARLFNIKYKGKTIFHVLVLKSFNGLQFITMHMKKFIYTAQPTLGKAETTHRGFLTPFAFYSNNLANCGSSRASIEAKIHNVFNFLGFVLYFSARIE